MTSPFFRRFVPAVLLLLALTIGPLLNSASSQVSVSVHIPFGNVSGATSSSTNNRLVTRSQFAHRGMRRSEQPIGSPGGCGRQTSAARRGAIFT
jgi:hypothetical protein